MMKIPELKIKPCPFCGKEMEFHRDSFVNKYGQKVVHQYYLHADTEQDCVLDEICEPFTIPAGDANEETGYIGYYAEKWNQRVKDGDVQEVKHRKWVPTGNALGYTEYHCSECNNYLFLDSKDELYPYCPYCGAKMDKE